MEGVALQNLKICFVMNKMDSGGAERVVSILANNFADRNLEVTILVTKNKSSFYKLNESINYESLNLNYDNLNTFRRLKVNTLEIVKLREYFNLKSPDIIISFIRNIPTIIAGKLARKRVIISERNNPIVDPPNPLWRKLRPLVYPFADGIVFQTEGARDYFEENIKKDSVIIPNPLDKNIRNVPIMAKKKQIVSVGRLAPQKDHATLIKSFKIVLNKFPDYKLLIYGQGDLLSDLTDLASTLGISDSVIFAGNTSDVFRKVAESKVFAFSSKHEGYPNSLIEAMAVGTAVVSTNCNFGPSEVIENGNNGYLVDVGDYEELAMKIIELINNEQLNMQFSKNGKILKDKLTVNKIADLWLDYINYVLM